MALASSERNRLRVSAESAAEGSPWFNRSWRRAVAVNVAVIILSLAAAEHYFLSHEPLDRRMEYSEDVFAADDVLGYKPAGGRKIGHRSYGGEQLLYDVTYTLDDQGLRVTSPAETEERHERACLAFFGDSFTFGEGMADQDTLPYRVWALVGQRYKTVNFGFLGYGPHQMLAAIEAGHLTTKGHCRPRHIVYQAIPAHVARAAGLEFWDSHGPRYVREPNGSVRLNGHFDDGAPSTTAEWLRLLNRRLAVSVQRTLSASAIYRTVLRSRRPVYEPDVALFASIVAAARQSANATFPEASFHVLFWDYDDDPVVSGQALAQLRALGIAVHPLSEVLPGFPAARARYEISPYDKHPNALAHRLIADFIADRLVGPSAESPGSKHELPVRQGRDRAT